MKKLFRFLTAVSLSALMAISFAACGGSEEPEEAPPAEEPAAEEGMIPEGTDFSSPSVVIEFGDYEGLNDLASDMQTLGTVEEGTVIKITGLLSMNAGPSVMQEKNDSQSGGLAMVMVGAADDQEYPPEDSRIEVTGVAVDGEYYTEFRVPVENLKAVE